MLGMSETDSPIACSLSDRESRNQIGEWEALIPYQVTTEQVEGGYAVTFQPEVADEVQGLARREAACCGFLNIISTTTTQGARLQMTSRSPEALPVIEMLLGRR